MSIFNRPAFNILLLLMILGTSCNKKDTGISKPIPDCFDGIKNQGELGIDCGGPCSFPCPSKMTAVVDGSNWESAGSVTTMVGTNYLRIDAGNSTGTISLIHQGPFETGTYSIDAYFKYTTTQVEYTADNGTITFNSWDHSEQIISGTFSFTAGEITGIPDSVYVTQGSFEFVTY